MQAPAVRDEPVTALLPVGEQRDEAEPRRQAEAEEHDDAVLPLALVPRHRQEERDQQQPG